MPPFENEKDDMDAYLKMFERYATSLKWPQDEWAVNLSALLKSKSEKVYGGLPLSAAGHYIRVKEALLKHFHLTQEGFRQKFRTCS